MSPLEAQERIIKELVPYYPLGELKNKGANKMLKEVVFAGFGGQGVLTAGLILSQVALFSGKKQPGCLNMAQP